MLKKEKKEKWRFSCQTQHFAGSLFKVGRAQDAINLSVCLDVLYHLLSGLYLSFFHSHLMKRHLAWKWAEAPLQPRQIKRFLIAPAYFLAKINGLVGNDLCRR